MQRYTSFSISNLAAKKERNADVAAMVSPGRAAIRTAFLQRVENNNERK